MASRQRTDEIAADLMRSADLLGCDEAAALCCTAVAEITMARDLDKAAGYSTQRSWSLRSAAKRRITKARRLLAECAGKS